MNKFINLLLFAAVGLVQYGVGASSCGASDVHQARIVNGETAKPGAWPWIASLQFHKRHHCGATLIAPSWILTAAHCVGGIKGWERFWSVKVGAHDMRVKHEPSVQVRNIQKVIVHPRWNPQTFDGDHALIKLDSPVKLNSRVALACLPEDGVYPANGKECWIAGWGAIKYPHGLSYHLLQQAKLPVVDSKKCKWNDEVVCVGKGMGTGPDGKQWPNACRGDSGGPLVCQRSDGHWVLEGVASFVYTFCKYYSGYSPVNKYRSWIDKYVQ